MPYETMHHSQQQQQQHQQQQHHHQTSTANGMFDTLSLQLREAEARRSEIERAHQETLAQIRNLSSTGGRQDIEAIENLQSRARELEKKAALENVRCEELQIELSAAMKSKSARSGASSGGGGGTNVASSATATSGTSTSVTWAPTIGHHDDQGSEIDIIMAKIEQARLSLANDNRVLAELENPRTSAGFSSLPTSSILNTTNSEFKTISKTELEEELNRYKRAVLGGSSGVTSGTVGSSAYTGYSSALTSTLPNGGSGGGASTANTGIVSSHSVTTSSVHGPGLTSISALVPNSIGGISSSLSSHAITAASAFGAATGSGAGTSAVDKLLSGTSGITGIPPLPVNIHTMKSMPSALSQAN